VAVSHRNQRLPRCDPTSEPAPEVSHAELARRGAVAPALPRPDLDEITSGEQGPEAVVIARETIELAFLAAIQLPPRQRAVLILRDVLDFSAAETAAQLDMSVAAANSALQRARSTMAANRPHGRIAAPPPAPSIEELKLLERFIEAHENADVATAAAMLREDARIAMPPHPFWFAGREHILQSLVVGLREPGEWRLLATGANRQPAAASYLRPTGDTEFRAFKLDVMRFEGGLVAEITTFDATLFPAFGLPSTLTRVRDGGV
jgi:RNA polymerase sigma-70 factor (TIGR02960 family)